MVTGYIENDITKLLGMDFLTWLWFKSETDNLFTVGTVECAIYTERRVTVEYGSGQTAEMASASGPASELKEARFGLSEGKKVTRATYRIEQGNEQWLVTLKATDFSLSGLRTPKIEKSDMKEEDNDGFFLEKMYLIETALDTIEVLYSLFLQCRLSSTWGKEIEDIRIWIKKSLEA